MPYNINRYNGTIVATVEDGTVDNTLDIKLIGRNYAGYGEVQNENIVHLLENFAGTSEPPRKIAGQIWYDSGSKKLKFYDGTQFRTTGGAEVGTNQPSGLTTGDFWFNTETNQLFAWSGTNFALIGPQAVENYGSTELKSISVTDTNNVTHPVVQGLINNQTIFIVSSADFELALNSPLRPTYTLIKQGINLIGTNLNTGDLDFGVTTSNYRFWGTSSSSMKLQDEDGNSYSPDDFIRADNLNFTGNVKFDDTGLTVGNDEDIKFYINEGNPTFENVVDNAIIMFKTKLSTDANLKTALKLQGADVLPGTANVSYLGRSDQKFASVYALEYFGSLKGTADFANTLRVDGTYIDGSVDADPNTLAARDGNGAITANQFIGTATKATNLNGGSSGAIVYQSAANTTAFLPLGSSNEILTVSAGGQLDWVPINSLVNAGNADQITITTSNLTNSVHYVTFVSDASGYQPLRVDQNALTYNPNTNTLTTGFFNGQAASASYADLAEKFLPDKEYAVGTVLMVGGDKEVTACEVGRRAIGVVSASPAYLMNNELEGGVAVALKGRVPVLVSGAVRKGSRLVAGPDGSAQATMTAQHDVFAVALETNNDYGLKLVECVIL